MDSNSLLKGLSPLVYNAMKPMLKYLDMKDINEIVINRPQEVFIESEKGWTKTIDEKLDLPTLKKFAKFLATHSGQEFNDNLPMLATHIPVYGYRVQIVGGMSDSGIGIAIRVGASKIFKLESYMSKTEAQKVRDAIRDKKNILVSGGTSTGKTSMTNNLISMIDIETRIIAIEDTKELIIPHPNHKRLLKSKTGTDAAKITYENIIDSVLRMRPDRIVIGEITIENTKPFLKLINTGHSGCISTIHANSAEESIYALAENLRLSGNTTDNTEVSVKYAKRAIDAVIHLTRVSRGNIKAEFVEIK